MNQRIFGARGVCALAAVLIGLSGCRPGVRPSVAVPVAVSPDSLQELLSSAAGPAALEGRGLARLTLPRQRIPTLDLQFDVCQEGSDRVVLRPGMLAPVLSFWASDDGWSLKLPRSRAVVVSGADPDATERDDSVPHQLAWFIVSPTSLAAELEKPQVVFHKDAWILRGPLRDRAGLRAVAEIWVDRGTRRVSRWNVQLPSGEWLLRVSYDPPASQITAGGRVELIAPGLDLRSEIVLKGVSGCEPHRTPGPPVPDSWQVIHPRQIPELLDRVSEGAE